MSKTIGKDELLIRLRHIHRCLTGAIANQDNEDMIYDFDGEALREVRLIIDIIQEHGLAS